MTRRRSTGAGMILPRSPFMAWQRQMGASSTSDLSPAQHAAAGDAEPPLVALVRKSAHGASPDRDVRHSAGCGGAGVGSIAGAPPPEPDDGDESLLQGGSHGSRGRPGMQGSGGSGGWGTTIGAWPPPPDDDESLLLQGGSHGSRGRPGMHGSGGISRGRGRHAGGRGEGPASWSASSRTTLLVAADGCRVAATTAKMTANANHMHLDDVAILAWVLFALLG